MAGADNSHMPRSRLGVVWILVMLVGGSVVAGCGSSDARDTPTPAQASPAPLTGQELLRAARRSGLRLEEKLNFRNAVPDASLTAVYARPTDTDSQHSRMGVELLSSVVTAVDRQKLLASSRPSNLHAFRVGNVLGWHRARPSSSLDRAMHELALGLSRACRCPLLWFR